MFGWCVGMRMDVYVWGVLMYEDGCVYLGGNMENCNASLTFLRSSEVHYRTDCTMICS